MAGKLISDLNSVGTLGLADQMEIDKDVSGVRTSYKTSVKDIVDFANHNVAEEYDSTSSYAIGDYCIYESVLYKCIGTTTGTFDSTKWTSVVVTDEMGQGGGGTGGHTIIDENGNSMTARAGLQFVGGADVSDDSINNKTIVDLASAGGIDGVFVDTNNVIVPVTTISASGLSYTATEDCFAYVYLWGGNSTRIKIDDVEVGANYSSDKDVYLIPLKKGQILTTTSGNQNNTYQVYGIQTGTTHSKFQPIIYSTEEREIGVWTDGKPLYQKTWRLSTPLTINANSWGTIETLSEQINVIYGIGGYDLGTEYVSYSVGGNCDTSNVLTIYNFRNSQQSYNIITLQYTKLSDVAGSGSWTPQGVPTHHYSTDEQIIGTWIDGKTLYQKTITATITSATQWIDTGIDGTEKIVGSNGVLFMNIGDILTLSSGDSGINAGINYMSVGVVTTGKWSVLFRTADSNARGNIVITLQYTKTS